MPAPGEVRRVYRLHDSVAEDCPGHGPAHLLVESAAEIGFRWDFRVLGWDRPGLPILSNSACPIQHFRAVVLTASKDKVSAVCWEGPCLDVSGTLQLLDSDHVREKDKALLRSILVGGVWNGFLLGKIQGQDVPCRFCGGRGHDGHLFWECTFPPLVEIREHPEFHDLMEMDKTSWPRCLLWHGWLPLISGTNGNSPWAEDPADGAANLLECALGPYPAALLQDWQLLVGFDAERAAASLVEDKVSGASSSGSGFFYRSYWADRRWGRLDDDVGRNIGSCRVIVLFLVLCRLFKRAGHSFSSGC